MNISCDKVQIQNTQKRLGFVSTVYPIIVWLGVLLMVYWGFWYFDVSGFQDSFQNVLSAFKEGTHVDEGHFMNLYVRPVALTFIIFLLWFFRHTGFVRFWAKIILQTVLFSLIFSMLRGH